MDDGPAIAVLDIAHLRNITLDDEALMREVVAALLSDASAKISALQEAIEARRGSECVQVAHSGAGACGNVGALSMASLFSTVERQAGRGDLAGCLPVVARLREELDKLRVAAAEIG